MNQQSTRPAREFRAVEKLTGGEHINHQAHQHDDVRTWQVGHVAPYTDDNSVPMVALMLALPSGGEPELIRERRGVTVPIATESEVASAEAEGNRFAVANALRQVADAIVAQALPVPRYSFTVGGVLGSRGELEMWAEHLGVEIRMSGDIPVVDKEADGLKVHFQSNPEPAVDAQTREIPAHDIEPGMTVIDGVDGRLVVTARYADGADAILVSFADVPEPTRFGSEVGVTVVADDAQQAGE